LIVHFVTIDGIVHRELSLHGCCRLAAGEGYEESNQQSWLSAFPEYGYGMPSR